MSALRQAIPETHAFETVSLDELESMDGLTRDALEFGVIGFTPEGDVDVYNAAEGRWAGLRPDSQIGQSLFVSVAPCMNNYLVAERFEEADELDETLPYVLTLKMRPTKVRLRLLKRPGVARRYVLIERRR